MRATAAKELFRQITMQYFSGATVIFSNQSRMAKPELGLVVITPGQVKRNSMPNYELVDNTLVGCYQNRISMTVDLFTHGAAVVENGRTVAYENTAMEDILAYCDYLNSPFVTDWSHRNDVSILIDGDAQDLTGAVNDNNYEFRARVVLAYYFTSRAVGRAAILEENSILYPVYQRDPETGEIERDPSGAPIITTDPATGEPVYTDEPPYDDPEEKVIEDGAIVTPEFTPTSTGGGNGILASQEDGYFSDAEIKEENE